MFSLINHIHSAGSLNKQENTKSKNYLLEDDLTLHIFSFLTLGEMKNISLTSKQWAVLGNDKYLTKQIKFTVNSSLKTLPNSLIVLKLELDLNARVLDDLPFSLVQLNLSRWDS